MNREASLSDDDSAQATVASPRTVPDPHDRAFFGHPAGLLTLFFAEMWERFSYYGMRAILALFMTTATVEGGLGFSNAQKGVIYALYTSLVYFAGLGGGWLADNMIGQRRAVFWGGVIIMMGHISLAFHGMPFFFGGLSLIIAGTGLLKPNISTIVGQLYGPADVRRDSGFAIYYMGINIGSFLGQTACGFLAEHSAFKRYVLGPIGVSPTTSWHWGFAAAAVGMFFGLVVFVWKGRLMGDAGLQPNPPRDAAEAAKRKKVLTIASIAVAVVIAVVSGQLYWWFRHNVDTDVISRRISIEFGAVLLGLTIYSFAKIQFFSGLDTEERRRITVVFILFLASVLFWSAFEQAGGSLNIFAKHKSQLTVFGKEFPASWYQNINPFGIILLSPLFAYAWLKFGNRGPSSPVKFASGLVLVGLGFVVAAYGSSQFDRLNPHIVHGIKLEEFRGDYARISPAWLFWAYVLHTIGELILSPIGLSMVTKLSPKRAVSQVMSIWFLANANGNFLAGQTIVLNDVYTNTQIYWAIAAITIAAGVVLALMVQPIKRLMGGVQ
jgi:POT family proton-dependent oligopeptide transporter